MAAPVHCGPQMRFTNAFRDAPKFTYCQGRIHATCALTYHRRMCNLQAASPCAHTCAPFRDLCSPEWSQPLLRRDECSARPNLAICDTRSPSEHAPAAVQMGPAAQRARTACDRAIGAARREAAAGAVQSRGGGGQRRCGQHAHISTAFQHAGRGRRTRAGPFRYPSSSTQATRPPNQ